jgi:hypothetical protein
MARHLPVSLNGYPRLPVSDRFPLVAVFRFLSPVLFPAIALAGKPCADGANRMCASIRQGWNTFGIGYRELRETLNLAIVAGMALSKFPFLTLQAGALLRSLASARLSR